MLQQQLENKLKQAIKNKDEFAVSVLLTRIKNAGFSIITIAQLEDELSRIDKIASAYKRSDDIGACYHYNNYHYKKQLLKELKNEVCKA